MENTVPLTKEEKQLNKQLTHHVERYSSLRDWSELTLWLSKLKTMLAEYKGTIVDKASLLKKLSTSLNPSLPTAVHESALQIYEIMLSKFVSIQNVEYLCLGLFSFYTNANIKSRIMVLEMMKMNLPKFGKEIRIMTTGLFITILPSLNQMNENLIKEVHQLFDKLFQPQLLGFDLIIQSIWIAILRSSPCRVAGLKYLSNKIGKIEENDENDDEEDNFWNETVLQPKKPSAQESISEPDIQDIKPIKKVEIKEYCPHIQTLTINALIACIEDQNILVTKTALDFLYKYIPLKTQIVTEQCKLKLANSILWLLSKRDMGVTRKINLWLFGKPDAQNKFNLNTKNLHFIIMPLRNYLKKNRTIEPLKIIFNLFHEHDQLPRLVMDQLTTDILTFCMKDDQNKNQSIKLLQRIIDKIHTNIDILSESLELNLKEAIENKNYRQGDYLLQMSMYLIYKVLRPAEMSKLLFRILRAIMRSYQTTKWQDLQFMRNSLKQTLQILENFKTNLKEQYELKMKEQDSEEYEQLEENIKIYSMLIEKIQNEKVEIPEQEIHNISTIQMKLYEIFGIYSKEWSDTIVNNIYLKNPQYYITPIEIIGEGLEKEGKLKQDLLKRAEENGENCIYVAISKLWSIMSLGHLHFKVVPLLLRLIKFFPHFFSEIAKLDFEMHLQMAISKFNIFWELSPKYPGIVSHQHLSEICKDGLFRMLNFLDNGNPLVKYNTKLWINECFPAFHRVVDPILQIILHPSGFWYKTIKGQYIFAIQPQTDKILSSLRYLKSIISTTPEKFFTFALKPLTLHIRPYYQVFIGKDNFEVLEKLDRQNKDKLSEMCYLRVIFGIVVRYLSSQFANIEKQSPGLQYAACDLLEIMVKKISNPLICLKFVCLVIEEIFLALHFAIINQEHIFQIRLLNLIDNLFFYSKLRQEGEAAAKKLKTIISAPFFMKTILQGLNTEFPYIKERFVQFINKSIILILEYHTKCSELISQILNTYLSKIMLVHSRKEDSSQQKDIEISKRNSQILILFGGIKEIFSFFLNLSVKPFEKQRQQYEPDSGIFNLYTWTSFVNLKIEKKGIQNSRARKNAQEITKMMPNELQNLLLTMTTCWTLTDLAPFYKISEEGLSEYDKVQFQEYNRRLQLLFGKQESEQSVQTFIVDLVRVLINNYPKQIMNGIIKNWVSANNVQQKIKIIQILNLSAISMEHFYKTMSQTINTQNSKKRKSHNLVFQNSAEQQIIHFCQFYTHYCLQKKLVPTFANQINLWVYFLKFVRMFEHSRNIKTLFALIQLIDLFFCKNNPKEILKDQKIRKEIQYIINIFNELVMVCNGKIKVLISKENQYGIHSFVPLPTSVFEIYSRQIGKIQEAKVFYMFFGNLTQQKIAIYCRVYAFIILQRIGFNYMHILYGDNEALLVKKGREVFSLILSVIQDKSQHNIFVECASQIVITLMDKKASFPKQMKYEILQIFNKDDFFICSSKTLHCWVRIIDKIIDINKDHDIFTEYLEKVSLVSSIFSSYTAETKKKIKSFERICFILYAGKKDKYNEKAHLLIQKIIDVIKNAQAPQPVLILIFFCIRILILRTSPERLTKLLSNLWQLVMFLLASIFRKEQDALKDKNNLNLIWAALKLIEMVSIMELNQFHPHQWIFFYDQIGLKLQMAPPENSTKLDLKIKPHIAKYLPANVNAFRDESIETVSEQGHLIIKQDKIDDSELLKTKALLLSSYLIRNNQCKMKFSMQQIQDLIENDFLHLDEFIFKFK